MSEEQVAYTAGMSNLLQSRDRCSVWYNIGDGNSNKLAVGCYKHRHGYDTRKVLLMQPHVTPSQSVQENIEEWRDVSGYEGYYQVSSFGRVRRLSGNDSAGRKRQGRVLRPSCSGGYLYVQLCKDGKAQVLRVHRLVAYAFLGECPHGCNVNHIDAVKINNRATNLEYTSVGGNVRHAVGMGLVGKLTKEQVWEIRQAYRGNPFVPYVETARKYGVNADTISAIVRVRRYSDLLDSDGSAAVPTRRGLKGVDVYGLYNDGHSLNAIARQYGVNVSTVSRAYHKVADLKG